MFAQRKSQSTSMSNIWWCSVSALGILILFCFRFVFDRVFVFFLFLSFSLFVSLFRLCHRQSVVTCSKLKRNVMSIESIDIHFSIQLIEIHERFSSMASMARRHVHFTWFLIKNWLWIFCSKWYRSNFTNDHTRLSLGVCWHKYTVYDRTFAKAIYSFEIGELLWIMAINIYQTALLVNIYWTVKKNQSILIKYFLYSRWSSIDAHFIVIHSLPYKGAEKKVNWNFEETLEKLRIFLSKHEKCTLF